MYRFKKLLFCAALSALLPLVPPAFAQEDEGETGVVEEAGKVFKMKEVVVSATKTEIDPRETGASITVITEKEIEKSGKTTVADLLNHVPGLTVVRSGSFGGNTAVFVRGAKSENVLVLIDGIRVNDSMGIGKDFDFANLQAVNIERIEIIRGPQSTLHGSDAVGGVINIITKKGKGKSTIQVSVEAGSYSTFKETLTVSGGTDEMNYSLGISRTDSDGFSKAENPPNTSGTLEKDGYQNTTLSSRFGVKLPYRAFLNTSFVYSDSVIDLDDGAYDDDPKYKGYQRNLSARTDFKQELLPWWNHVLAVGYSSTLRKYRDKTDHLEPVAFDNSWYEGIFRKIEWQHNFPVVSIDTITVGIEYSDETGSSLAHYDYGFGADQDEFDATRSSNVGYYAQNHLKLFNRLFHTLGMRIDDHKEFDTKASYQTSLSFIAPVTDTRLKASYSTGFKAPSLYQLYAPSGAFGPVGNENLKPEENISYDCGIEQPLLDEIIVLGITYFNNRYKNMIDFESGVGYKNVGKVDTHGVESLFSAKLPYNFTATASYTYTHTKDKDTGKKLVRRPEHQASAGLNWEPLKGANINVSFIYVGERDDVWYDASFAKHEETMDSYYKIDLYASYWLTSYLQVFGRIENLTDEKYQAVVGYKSPERSYYGGVKGSL